MSDKCHCGLPLRPTLGCAHHVFRGSEEFYALPDYAQADLAKGLTVTLIMHDVLGLGFCQNAIFFLIDKKDHPGAIPLAHYKI